MTTPTKAHTPGRFKRIADVKNGEVIYLRPDHAHYKPNEFAIVNRQDIRGHVIMAEGVRRFQQTHDDNRCVEVVGQDLASQCTGIPRSEIKRACHAAKDKTKAVAYRPGDLTSYVFAAGSSAQDVAERAFMKDVAERKSIVCPQCGHAGTCVLPTEHRRGVCANREDAGTPA